MTKKKYRYLIIILFLIRILSGCNKSVSEIDTNTITTPDVVYGASGLDPGQRISLRNYIAEIAEDKIVLLATHIVADVEQIADEVIFLGDGRILRKENRQELLKQEKNMEQLYLQVYGKDENND